MPKFDVTFSRWDEDAYTLGDPLAQGFVCEDVSFREALTEVGGVHASYEASVWPITPSNIRCVRWVCNATYNDGTKEHIEDGITEERSLHFPKNITLASRRRILKLIGLL